MTVSLVQSDHTNREGSAATSIVGTLSAATAGNALILFVNCERQVENKFCIPPAGWTTQFEEVRDGYHFLVATKVAAGGETSVTVQYGDHTHPTGGTVADSFSALVVAEVSGVYDSLVSRSAGSESNPHSIPTLTPASGIEALLFIAAQSSPTYSPTVNPSGYTLHSTDPQGPTGYGRILPAWKEVPSTSGSYSSSIQYAGGLSSFIGIHVLFVAFPPVGITITADPTSGDAILAVHFDTIPEGGTPSAYLWDFGDGVTSTDDNPIHAYTEPGIYDVLLTATILGDDYTDTITITVNFADYTPPAPGRAILEIKASDPGSARWDTAEWDEAVWSSASWQDVTPYGVEVFITWGSSRPEFGILSTPEACTWSITFYDPDRVLDPANESSPYFGDLEPLLPVRLRLSSGQIIKQGFLESASHRHANGTGYWRVMDIQALLANAVVPADTSLSGQLFSRARDVIAAAGLSITVADDPPGGDLSVTAWETGHEATAWEWITDAAQQVLWVPYVRKDNTLGFRDYREPYNRSRTIGSPNFVDLQSLIMHNGLFSIVTAGVETRELTPKPRYGAREYVRDGVVDGTTPDDGAWAQAVLDDRAVAGLRWVPGRVVPFTAQEVKYFAELEAIEQVGISFPEAVPPVIADGIIVGGEIHVRGKKDDDAIWDFLFHVAQIPDQPLVDDSDESSYLVRDDDPTEYLYPDA